MRIITVTAFVAMSVACGGSGLPTTQPSPINAVDAGRSLVAVEQGRSLSETAGTLPSSGRFKASPDGTCVFVPNDGGPNQCTPAGGSTTPPSAGRFKTAPDGTCTFDPNDSGPNQCTPAVVIPGNPPVGGRFKAGPGGTCVFVPNDAGPNQCTP